jgi:putative endonuclease
MHYLYILRCGDGSLYVGRTKDVSQRERWHNLGRGPLYMQKRLPVNVVYTETHPSETCAGRRERQIKRWTTAKKEALVGADLPALQGFSARQKIRPTTPWSELLKGS